MSDIIYTHVDEAPQIASTSLLPVIQAFARQAGISIGTKDISLSGRIIAQFSDRLTDEQKQSDDLAWLGEWVKTPEANVIKLPNISASVAQLKACVAELQAKGYDIPNYPEDPQTEEETAILQGFNAVKGSAVNPVLRQGNSDRRAAAPIKRYAQKHPHRMGEWLTTSKTNVAHMTQGDFFANEQSMTITADEAGMARIEFEDNSGHVHVLKTDIELAEGDVIDSTHLSVVDLQHCIVDAMQRAKADHILLSLHMKATMMKVSDPIIFGHVVKTYFASVFEKHADTFAQLGVNAEHGMGDVYAKIIQLPESEQAAIKADIATALSEGPDLAMVDSDKGITNLRIPSDVIVDASMAAAIRAGGKMWGPDGAEHDTLAIIPDRCYAGIYQAAIDFCREHGAFDPTTMGSVANVGLMAQKAEEYGSHHKTFKASADGTMRVVLASGKVCLEQSVSVGDIFRSCTVKAAPIKDWVQLAVSRARLSNTPVMFWLNENRAHDAELIKKLHVYLGELDTDGLDIQIMAPTEAMQHTLERVKKGENSIAATGNVLRDYLTDLFPILELGTSAKMLSIVPLANGGGLFETGAGGSAPKHVQQFMDFGHLRWDSLGEYMALAESLAHLARTKDNLKAQVLADSLEKATSQLLDNNRSPRQSLTALSTNDTHFYETLYWAQALAEQDQDADLKAIFTPIARTLSENCEKILDELRAARGHAVDCRGYYQMSPTSVAAITCASDTLNQVLNTLS